MTCTARCDWSIVLTSDPDWLISSRARTTRCDWSVALRASGNTQSSTKSPRTVVGAGTIAMLCSMLMVSGILSICDFFPLRIRLRVVVVDGRIVEK